MRIELGPKTALLLAIWLVLTTALPAAAHELTAPETVQAEADGGFVAPATFTIGPGPERIGYILFLAMDNSEPLGGEYTYFCVKEFPEGNVQNVSFEASLIETSQPARLTISAETCGVSGDQTYFETFTTILPHEPQRTGAVYWTDTGGIYRARLKGSTPEEVVAPAVAQADDKIAVDPIEGRVYWNSFEPSLIAGVIRRARIQEGVPEIFLIGTKGGLGGIAADSTDRSLYFADPSDCIPMCGAVGRVEFDLTGLEELIALDVPDALAVSPELGRMCWTDAFHSTIGCADTDGSNASVFLSGLNVRGLAIDAVENMIYWSESSPAAIRRADLGAADPVSEEVVTEGLSDPQGVAFDPVFRRVYWADRGTGKIQRADPAGILVEDVVTGLAAPEGVALDWGGGNVELSVGPGTIGWEPIAGAMRFDVITGDLNALRASGGDYASAEIGCVAEVAGTTTPFTATPASGEALFLLARPVSGTGDGTYDSLSLSQEGARDAEISASGGDCP